MNGSDNIRLSVIVPFHNAEGTIARCVESLLSQTIDDVQLVFVDDGSTDSSLVALHAAIANTDRSVVVESTGNACRGTAYARQLGIDLAVGEFITFCDADDTVEPETYSQMLALADERNADVVCCGIREIYPKRIRIHNFNVESFPDLNHMPLDTLHCSLCTKIVRRKLLADIRFFEGIDCWEDLGVTFRLRLATDRFAICYSPFYNYTRGIASSLTTADMTRILNDHLALADAAERWFDARPELKSKYEHFLNFLKFTAKIKMLRGPHKDLRRWATTYPEANRRIMSYRGIPFGYRLLFKAAHIISKILY